MFTTYCTVADGKEHPPEKITSSPNYLFLLVRFRASTESDPNLTPCEGFGGKTFLSLGDFSFQGRKKNNGISRLCNKAKSNVAKDLGVYSSGVFSNNLQVADVGHLSHVLGLIYGRGERTFHYVPVRSIQNGLLWTSMGFYLNTCKNRI